MSKFATSIKNLVTSSIKPIKFMFKKLLNPKAWAFFMLMLVSLQTMATDVFTSNRTDFRDESIYFMITTRFYDGDPSNNVLGTTRKHR